MRLRWTDRALARVGETTRYIAADDPAVRSRRAGRDLVLAVASLAWAAAIACASVFWIVLMYLDLLSRQS